MSHDESLYLKTLAEFTKTLLTSYDVDTMLGELTARLTGVLQLAGSGVSLARDGRLAFVMGLPERVVALEEEQIARQDGPCVESYRRSEVIAVDDLAAHGERWPHYAQVAEQVGIRAVAGIPMTLEDQRVGALNLYSTDVRAWSPRDLSAAQVMAHMATAYLINASMYENKRRLSEQLQQALDSRVVIEQAKGVLANEHGIGMDEAFERIRRHARSHGATVRAVSEAVVRVGLRPG